MRSHPPYQRSRHQRCHAPGRQQSLSQNGRRPTDDDGASPRGDIRETVGLGEQRSP